MLLQALALFVVKCVRARFCIHYRVPVKIFLLPLNDDAGSRRDQNTLGSSSECSCKRVASHPALSKSPTLPHPLFSALLVSPLPGNTNSGKAGRRKASLSSFIAAAAVNESRLEWSESALTPRVSADGCMLAFPPQTDVRLEITGWPPTIARDALRPWTRV